MALPVSIVSFSATCLLDWLCLCLIRTLDGGEDKLLNELLLEVKDDHALSAEGESLLLDGFPVLLLANVGKEANNGVVLVWWLASGDRTGGYRAGSATSAGAFGGDRGSKPLRVSMHGDIPR